MGIGTDFSGFPCNLENLTISLPEQKMGGAKVFPNALFDKRGSHFLTLLEVHQMRGNLEHFQTTNEMWKTIKAPTDILLGHSDVNSMYIRCPNTKVRQMVWDSTQAMQQCMETEDSWMDLFTGKLVRL